MKGICLPRPRLGAAAVVLGLWLAGSPVLAEGYNVALNGLSGKNAIQVGATLDITWTPENPEEIPLFSYTVSYKTGSQGYVPIQSCSGIVESRCSWIVPDIPGQDIKIQVRDFYGANGESASFAVAKLAFSNLANGETLTIGRTKTVQWEAKEVSGKVTLELSKDDFVNSQVLVTADASAGSYSWQVPNDGTLAARIRIRSVEDTSLNATSAPFAIKHPLRIHILNIGNGTCTLIQCPGVQAAPLVVDCGSDGTSRTARQNLVKAAMGKAELLPYAEGILGKRTDAGYITPNLAISHPDSDHHSLVMDVFANQLFNNVYLGGVWPAPKPSAQLTGTERLINWLDRDDVRPKPTVVTGLTRLPANWNNNSQPVTDLACGDAKTYVLTVNTPPAGKNNPSNANSIVLMLKYGEFTVVLPGDAEGGTEDKASQELKKITHARVDLLSASHHGAVSHRSNSKEWGRDTNPRIVTFSAAERHNHPRCASMTDYYKLAEAAYDANQGTSGVGRHRVICGMDSDGDKTRDKLDFSKIPVITIKSKWRGFMTSLPLFTTADSGTILVEVTADYKATDAIDGTAESLKITFLP